MLHHKFKVAGTVETIINLSRENIAGIAGTAKESLIRTLGDFRDEGMISLKRQSHRGARGKEAAAFTELIY